MQITQTNKTILFEEFTPEQNSLSKILKGPGTPDSKAIKVDQEMTVTSFEEFVKKFPPVFYESVVGDGTEHFQIRYTLTKNETEEKNGIRFERKNLLTQPFYETILKLYREKGGSGQSNATFDRYEEIKEAMTPKAAMNRAKEIRGQLEYNFKEYLKLKDQGASQYELSDAIESVVELREQICEEYLNKSLINMLPLAIDDTDQTLKLLQSGQPVADDDGNSDDPPKMIPCTLSFSETGQIQALPVVTDAGADVKMLETSGAPTLLGLVENDYDNYEGNNYTGDTFVRNMVLSTFVAGGGNQQTSLANLSPADREAYVEELKEKQNVYTNIYKAAQQSFADSMCRLVERLINVQAFFDHAPKGTELVVTNCQFTELVKDDVIRDRFKEYINTKGNQRDDTRIWFAIVPALYEKGKEFNDQNAVYTDADMNNPFARKKGSSLKGGEGLAHFSQFPGFMEIMGEARIITFFNFKGTEKTGFANFSPELVRLYKKKMEGFAKDAKPYSVFCYPNFTVLPLSQTKIHLFGDGSDEKPFVDIDSPSIYIDASYVACGLTCASQNLEKLKQKKFKVLENGDKITMPVRFDFEDEEMINAEGEKVEARKVLTTCLNRENYHGTSSPALWEEVNKDGGYGFCFTGEIVTVKGQTLKYSYVHKARTLAQDEESLDAERKVSKYRPIYKTMVKTYLDNLALLEWDNLKKICSDANRKANREYVNNLLYNKINRGTKDLESINTDSADGNIHVVYGGTAETIKRVTKETN